MSWGAIFVYVFCGCIAGYAVAQAQINLQRSKKMLFEINETRAAAMREFERWRKAADACEQIRAELKLPAAPAALVDPFNRPRDCLCREVLGGELKIEDYCPAHRARREGG